MDISGHAKLFMATVIILSSQNIFCPQSKNAVSECSFFRFVFLIREIVLDMKSCSLSLFPKNFENGIERV